MLPEMLEAGMLVLDECKKGEKTAYDTVIAVYLAMRAIEEIVILKAASGSVH